MSETTQAEALRQAVAGARRERHAPHGYRSGLIRRVSLHPPLNHRVGGSNSRALLAPPPHQPAVRVLQQIHVRVARRSRGR